MADLAIGISKVAVEALVSKVKDAMKEEAELWQIVQQDTVFMRDEFEMMQSFLNTANGERIKNSVGRTWVRHVRDLSYDAEDFVDSVVLLDTKRSFWTIWLRVLASCCCSSGGPSPLDQAVTEVKLLKARVEEARNRSMRYSLANDPGDISAVTQKKPTVCATSEVDILAEAWRTAKKQGGLVDLTMLVTENSDALRVISLWETGGHLGMTSIIKEAYEKPEICQKFRARAWLKLVHPFNPQEFVRSMAHQFYGISMCRNAETESLNSKKHGVEIHGVDALPGLEAGRGTDLVEEFVRQLSKDKYLVVIEGLSSMAEWHTVRTYLPDSKNGSRIVVSTQHLEIARLCTGQSHQVLELRKLPDNHSVCVFFHQGFKRVEEGTVYGRSSMLESGDCIHLIGRKSDEEKLLNLVSRAGSETAHVISVCGFPGLGKSALVKSIFQHYMGNQVKTTPFDKFFWVDISYPFNFIKFCRRLHSFMLQEKQAEYVSIPKQSEPDEKIIQDCIAHLQKFRCILVIDGLRSKEEWDTIKSLICLPSRSCILVVPAEKDIAKYCAQQDDALYEVKALPFEAALDLFKQDFRGTGTFRDTHMLEAKYVLAKCGGIPKVIVALATYLGTQQEDIGQLKLKLNLLKTNFMQELETNPAFLGLRDLFAWMHSHYCELPQCLKPCILYRSVFSQVKIIRRSRFVRRWIAEGYSKCTDSKTMEEHTVKLFNMLAKHTAMVPELCDNSFFNEYIKLRLMEEGVIIFPPEVTVLDESHSMTAEWQGQHLTIESSWKREYVSSFAEWDLSHLQSLTVHGQWSRFFIPYRIRSLRVLDLEGTHHVEDDELNRFLELLPRLRFLSLRGHKEITQLPDSLSTLRHLQTLDIRGTSVLYVDLQQLQKLQYIRAGISKSLQYDDGSAAEDQLTPSSISSRTLVSFLPKFLRCGPDVPCNGIKVPGGIRHLESLQTLGAINVNTANGNTILDDIYLLKQLKKLDLSGINRKNSKKLCRAIINQKNLESLSLQLERENHVVHWDHISPPSSVRSLKLYGHVEELSALRIKSLRNLNKLSLEMTRLLTPRDIQLLGSMSNLHTLRLHVKKGQHGELQISRGLFSKLHDFEIACRSKVHLKFDRGTMAKLELLKVHCCGEWNTEFSGLDDLVSLKQVCLNGYEKLEALKQQVAKHSNKVSLKLN